MKRLLRITAASDSEDSKLLDMMKELKDDFDYILAGFEKLDRMGSSKSNEGYAIAIKLSDMFQSTISQISDKL